MCGRMQMHLCSLHEHMCGNYKIDRYPQIAYHGKALHALSSKMFVCMWLTNSWQSYGARIFNERVGLNCGERRLLWAWNHMSRLFLWWGTNITLWAILRNITSAACNVTWKVLLHGSHLTGRVQVTQSCPLWRDTSGMQFVAPSHVVRPHCAHTCRSHPMLRVEARVSECICIYAVFMSTCGNYKIDKYPQIAYYDCN